MCVVSGPPTGVPWVNSVFALCSLTGVACTTRVLCGSSASTALVYTCCYLWLAGHLKLEFVAPANSLDKIAKCLTSVQLDLLADCSVQLTSLQSHGSYVPSMWSAVGDEAYEVTTFAECPTQRPAVAAVQGSGTKLEAVRRAVIKAFASYVYGLDAYAQYINEIPIPDLDFFPGKLIIKRVDAMNLVYAITEVSCAPGAFLGSRNEAAEGARFEGLHQCLWSKPVVQGQQCCHLAESPCPDPAPFATSPCLSSVQHAVH